jgi:hypothetical protein
MVTFKLRIKNTEQSRIVWDAVLETKLAEAMNDVGEAHGESPTFELETVEE